MIKLIASDIDGTLVEDGGNSLKAEFYETVLKLKEQGIYFAAASGRQPVSIENIFEPIRDKIFYIGVNGAYVGCYGRDLFMTPYPYEFSQAVIAHMRTLGLDLMLDGKSCVYTDSKNEAFIDWLEKGYQFRVERVADVTKLTEPYMKISGCRMNGIKEEEMASFKEKYGRDLKVTLAGKQWLDTMDPAVNKGNAVKLLQESLGILPEETMVFGDQLNDVEMVRQGYYSFAVANARPETKAAARFLADSCERDGVLKVIRRLLQ